MERENLSLIQKAVKKVGWEKVYDSLDDYQKVCLLYDWRSFARREQTQKDLSKSIWLYLAGRGSGKTRAGAEWIRERVREGYKRGALVARTAADVRDTLVEGEAGILATSPPWEMPEYEPSKRRLTWPGIMISYPNNVVKVKRPAIMTTYSGDEPDQLRGPSHDFAWADELAAWKHLEDAWSNLLLGLRLRTPDGKEPLCCVTTTPRPLKAIRELLADKANTEVTTGTTYDNRENLAPAFYNQIIKRFEGTRLGRQELLAEILDDNPNALFDRETLNKYRIRESECPEMMRIAVAIDPAVTSGEESADTGIVACGMDEAEDYYVLADNTCHEKPNGWARRSIKLYCKLQADIIVGEVNNGGDLIEAVIRNIAKDEAGGIYIAGQDIPYNSVRASRGKYIRAEPVSTLAEQGRLHVVGSFPELEDQMVQWSPDLNEKSPDRLDALVWAITELMTGVSPGLTIL